MTEANGNTSSLTKQRQKQLEVLPLASVIVFCHCFVRLEVLLLASVIVFIFVL
jgi:hypothetical protein